MILTSQIAHSSKKCEINCPESRKKLTTQYKSCLKDADAKRPGSKIGEVFRMSFMDEP